jgi:hypothetical protein
VMFKSEVVGAGKVVEGTLLTSSFWMPFCGNKGSKPSQPAC